MLVYNGMQKKSIKSISFFVRSDNKSAEIWREKIEAFIIKKYPKIKISDKMPDAVIVLGGDGAILEAARIHQKTGALIFGLNLGHVGFLASVRQENDFLAGIKKLLSGKFWISERVMFGASVIRNGKKVFSADAINDIIIQNPLSIVELGVSVENHLLQFIRGSGVLISTPTGSTAYNLSAHGPIVSPDIKCLIITEILDHNIPTPSLVVNNDNKISIEILDFRKNGILKLYSGQEANVLFSADGEKVFPLKIGDKIIVRNSNRIIKFAEVEKNYFFKSLKEKFSFK